MVLAVGHGSVQPCPCTVSLHPGWLCLTGPGKGDVLQGHVLSSSWPGSLLWDCSCCTFAHQQMILLEVGPESFHIHHGECLVWERRG